MTCVIDSEKKWRYKYRGTTQNVVYTFNYYTPPVNTFTFRVTVSDQDQYWYSVAGPSDVTYAQIAITSGENKKKKRKGETSTSPGPVYSELKKAESVHDHKYTHWSNRVNLNVIERPKPVVILQPDKQTFRGETVILRCEIQGERDTDWEYSWYKKSSSLSPVSKGQEYTISPVSESHSGEYTCRGKRRRDSQNSKMSDAVTLIVSSGSKPKPQLTSSLKGAVLRGNTVTLSCKQDQSTRWVFYWYRHTQDSSALTHTVEDSYTISSVTHSDGGQYWCRAGRGNPVYYTQYSDAVWVNVTESPKAVVILQPDKQTFRGETVILRCEIQGDKDTEWEYSWYRKSSSLSPVSKGQEYRISPVSEFHSGEYTCRGKRSRDSQNSEMSNAVTLIVSSGESVSPPASLIISPNTTQHFTSDSLSLSCEVQNNSTGWTVRRYTDNGEVSDCSSDWGSVTGSTCNISSIQSSDSGVYWCQCDSGENSNPLNITVTYGDVILESPVHPVTEGDTLTLRCRYRNASSDLRADFYKDGLVLQNQTTGEMTIPTVSKSDEGLYWCKNPERGESPKSWITVRGVVVGLGVAFGLLVLMILCYCSKKLKDKTSTPEEDTVYSQLKSNTTTGTADIYDTIKSPDEGSRGNVHIYDDIDIPSRGNRDDPVDGPRDKTDTPQEDTVFLLLSSNTTTGEMSGKPGPIYTKLNLCCQISVSGSLSPGQNPGR
ncbi:basement membrane-specific heparan sulfate proteoglycan core protein-like [Chanos chanos]|uniref:Basement membrane-specific heparan sulfate proteoglycan core protein-like n=1 Tax=Chanos chanos TaxID=29144 RepID=A0A6J2VQH4_CHACN|nr:basement membrane-specific heparan sulfate proteoglycan core protein-like [Chanos chanos]